MATSWPICGGSPLVLPVSNAQFLLAVAIGMEIGLEMIERDERQYDASGQGIARIEAKAQPAGLGELALGGIADRVAQGHIVQHHQRLAAEFDPQMTDMDGAMQPGAGDALGHRPEPVPVPYQDQHDEQGDDCAGGDQPGFALGFRHPPAIVMAASHALPGSATLWP